METTAGEPVSFSYTMREPLPDRVALRSYISFKGPGDAHVWTNGNLSADRKTFDFVVPIPRDTAEGDYVLETLQIGVGHMSTDLKPLPDVRFIVRSDPTFVIPSIEGDLSSNPTKAQLLRSRAKQIHTRLDDLIKNPRALAGPDRIRTLSALQRALFEEDKALAETKSDYLKLVGNDNRLKEAAAADFDEIANQYAKLEKRIQIGLKVDLGVQRGLVLASYDKTEPTTVLRQDTINEVAGSERTLLLMAAYGEYVPPVLVQTFPQGATITYYRDNDTPKSASKVSDVSVDFLTWAEWTFKAVLAGYPDKTAPYDPYTDTHRVVEICIDSKICK